MKSLIDVIVQLIVDVLQLIYQWLKENKLISRVLFYSVFASLAAYTLFNLFYKREIRILTGPDGSAGVQYAEDLKKAFNVTLSRRPLKPEPTQGFADNLEIISNDDDGNVIGFSQIGFGDMTSVRVLLPLENNYLYILCSRGFFKHLVKECALCKKVDKTGVVVDGDENVVVEDLQKRLPLVIRDVSGTSIAGEQNKPPVPNCDDVFRKFCLFELLYAHRNLVDTSDSSGTKTISLAEDKRTVREKYLEKLRISLGKEKSGANELATKVLEHYGIRVNDPKLRKYYSFDQSSSFSRSFEKLRDGELDLVFYVGPMGSDLVTEQVDHAFLIGLGKSAENLNKRLGNPIDVDTFQDGLFGENISQSNLNYEYCQLEIKSPDGRTWCMDMPPFCDDVEVIRTRRVLICSDDMSKSDAYHIASNAESVLSNKIGAVNWNTLIKQNGSNASQLVARVHDGAVLLRDGKSLSWLDNIRKYWDDSKLLILFGLLGYVLSWWGNRRFGNSGPEGEQDGDGNPNNDPPSASAEAEVTPEMANAEAGERFGFFNGCVERIREELVFTELAMTATQYKKLISRFELLAKRILEDGKLRDRDQEVLLESVSQLRQEFEENYVVKSR